MGGLKSGQCGRGALNSVRTDSPLGQHFAQDNAIRFVVINDKNRTALEDFRIPGFQLARLACVYFEMTSEMKGAAMAQFTLDPNFSSHQFHQTRGDAKTEASAPVKASGGAVGLRESFENGGLFFFGNANSGVSDRKMQFDSLTG